MVCKKCGRVEPSANAKFCHNCGQAFYETKVNVEPPATETAVSQKGTKWAGIIVISIILLLIVVLIKYANHTDSVKYLREQLIHGDWIIEHEDYDITANFYSNGVFRYEYSDGSGRTFEWELLEDKTLVFDDRYYEYGEWSCENGVIEIGDRWEFVERAD